MLVEMIKSIDEDDYSCYDGDYPIPDDIFWWLDNNNITYAVKEHQQRGDDFGAIFCFDSAEDAMAFKLRWV